MQAAVEAVHALQLVRCWHRSLTSGHATLLPDAPAMGCCRDQHKFSPSTAPDFAVITYLASTACHYSSLALTGSCRFNHAMLPWARSCSEPGMPGLVKVCGGAGSDLLLDVGEGTFGQAVRHWGLAAAAAKVL